MIHIPPKQRITKEFLLEKAFKIVKENGIDYLTARNVAKEAGCSIQPVFSQFESIEFFKQQTFEFACQKLMTEIIKFKESPDFFSKASMWVIHLAREEKHLFHLLYLSDSYRSENLSEVMLGYESNRDILSKMVKIYELDMDTCKDILIKGFLLLHGIATMISTNHIEFTDSQISLMMKQTVEDMVNGAKNRKENQELCKK